MINKQKEMIRSLSDRQMVRQLYLTQFILIFISIVLSTLLLGSPFATFSKLNVYEPKIYLIGVLTACAVILIDFLIMKFLPKSWYDDGGINEKLFRTCKLPHILFLALLISFTEEWLFRGILQNAFGIWVASAIFSLLHFRYLNSMLLFTVVVLVSFLLGIMYEMTGNLLTTITAHFIIDFVFAVQIRIEYLKRGGSISNDESS
ncbi:CPBP family intramembrane glutamic endopeptidase [Metabacillus sp. RGM 3146]|uniref:CPBP family intramembrane glutamic endopeptidase n=1 Tax=Metabacillus sp. RGM 3146 TaxID=3401092 RepID=UPI003B9C5CA4